MAARHPPAYVGVDVSEHRGLDVVVLGADRRLLTSPVSRLGPAALAGLLARWAPVAVAIDSPPAFGTSGTSRAPERELAALGIPSFRTPSDPRRCAHPFYNWVRVGIEAFAAARHAGYPLYAGGPSVAGRALEVFPHAAAVALHGRRPPAGTSRRPAAKRRWRAAALAAAGIGTGPLPTLDAVDAALAALTALLADEGVFYAAGGGDDYVVVPGTRPPGPYPSSERPPD